MKKILIAVAGLLVVALAWTTLYKEEVAPAPIATYTPVVATNTPITVDYSKLEKDTIYTEEEGKYENLPAEGKRLLEELIGLPECAKNPKGLYCDEKRLRIQYSFIVALKDEVLLYHVPRAGGVAYRFFDLKNRISMGKEFVSGELGIENSEILLLVKSAGILYYKPGMKSFLEVPNSLLKNYPQEYYIDSALGAKSDKKIKGTILQISIFSYDRDKMQDKKIREVGFNLNTLK